MFKKNSRGQTLTPPLTRGPPCGPLLRMSQSRRTWGVGGRWYLCQASRLLSSLLGILMYPGREASGLNVQVARAVLIRLHPFQRASSSTCLSIMCVKNGAEWSIRSVSKWRLSSGSGFRARVETPSKTTMTQWSSGFGPREKSGRRRYEMK